MNCTNEKDSERKVKNKYNVTRYDIRYMQRVEIIHASQRNGVANLMSHTSTQTRRRILISEEITGEAIDRLERSFDVVRKPQLFQDRAALLHAVKDVDGLVVRNRTLVTRELLAAAARLQVVGRAGAGLDNIDLKAAEEFGVVVASAPDENSVSVAELAMGLILSLARHIPAASDATRRGTWERQRFTGMELAGKRLGLVGLGRIGFRVATRARAFGMSVLAYDPFLKPSHVFVGESGAELVGLEELLGSADVLSVHLPLTPATAKLLNRDRLSLIKSGALLVNTSRGEIIDEGALVEALQSGRLSGAALDVRQEEPPATGALEELPNVVLTPHIAAFTRESMQRVVEAIASDVERVLTGDDAAGAVGRRRPGPARS